MLAGFTICAEPLAASTATGSNEETVLKSSHFSVRFQWRDHLRLRELKHAATKRNYLRTADAARRFVVTTPAGQWDAASFDVARVERDRSRVTFHLACRQPPLEATLRAEAAGADEVRLRLRNAGPEPLTAKVAFPVLGELQTGNDLASIESLYPLNGGCVGSIPAHLKFADGNCFIQVMDMADAQGGLMLRVEDNQAQMKVFEFLKRLSPAQAPPRAFMVAKTSRIGKQHGDEWAMTDKTDKPYAYYCADYEQNLSFCPKVTEWQDYLARELARIVRETDCDLIYLDSVGMRSERCWNTRHARYHRPGDGWYQGVGELLRKVRTAIKAVKQDCALLTEHLSCDVNTQFLDGSLSYSVHGAQDLRRQGIPLNPTGTTLFRFLFSEFKLFELPAGGSSDVEGYTLGFFNGNAVHGASAAPPVKSVLAPMSRVFSHNRDAFTAAQPVPLIPTLHPAVRANKFPARNKVLYTIYNLSDQPVDRALLEVDFKPNVRFTELLTGRPVRAEILGRKARLSARIEPKEVLCLSAVHP